MIRQLQGGQPYSFSVPGARYRFELVYEFREWAASVWIPHEWAHKLLLTMLLTWMIQHQMFQVLCFCVLHLVRTFPRSVCFSQMHLSLNGGSWPPGLFLVPGYFIFLNHFFHCRLNDQWTAAVHQLYVYYLYTDDIMIIHDILHLMLKCFLPLVSQWISTDCIFLSLNMTPYFLFIYSDMHLMSVKQVSSPSHLHYSCYKRSVVPSPASLISLYWR